ncbi:MAG: hypothetical protein HN909_07525 [Phycisphaerales bacterium]|jgi:hypothetical protein|nr:hypothetical protein [Phycisphaerales bacterium]MBT7171603.1 hypothetical protein [Phycisphaerales bacterium]
MSNIAPAITDFIAAHRLDTLEGAFDFDGGADLVKPGLGNRRRTKIDLPDAPSLFLKRYYRLPLSKRIKTLLNPRKWMCEAMIEHNNIRAVEAAGLRTMHPLAADVEGSLLGGRRSYTLVDAVAGETLETAIGPLVQERGEEITEAIATLARALHHAGFVHRDFYLCHIFADTANGPIELSLIDLARVIRPSRLRQFRWRVKDLSQLYYSCSQEFREAHWNTLLARYLDTTSSSATFVRWNRAIQAKAARIARHDQKRHARFTETKSS